MVPGFTECVKLSRLGHIESPTRQLLPMPFHRRVPVKNLVPSHCARPPYFAPIPSSFSDYAPSFLTVVASHVPCYSSRCAPLTALSSVHCSPSRNLPWAPSPPLELSSSSLGPIPDIPIIFFSPCRYCSTRLNGYVLRFVFLEVFPP